MNKHTYGTSVFQRLFSMLYGVAEKVGTYPRIGKARYTESTPHTTGHVSQVPQTEKDTVAIVGLGYVGLPLALLADKKGFQVIGIDANETLVEDIKSFNAPKSLNTEETHTFSKHTIKASMDAAQVREASTVLICVPTPVHKNHTPDLRPVLTAVRNIAPHIKPGTLIIVESTVSPGVNENIVIPAIERGSKLEREKTLFFAHCPERINPGDSKWNVENIPRVVGGVGPESLERAASFYERILHTQIRRMSSIREAEAVKMVENSFRDVNIAFVNELAMSFQKLGIDVRNVLEGAATKPFGFMPHMPGCGVGGHCIPVDPYYLIAEAKRNGFNHRFLKVARDVNNKMPEYTIGLLKTALQEKGKHIRGSRIALLGLAYKKDISDTRESPALKMLFLLSQLGAHVQSFDPYAKQLSSVHSLTQALNNADAVLLATDHTEFLAVTPELLKEHQVEVVIDGRNFFDKQKLIDAGINYKGIGI